MIDLVLLGNSQGGVNPFTSFTFLLVIFFIFWFFIIRPQAKRTKLLEEQKSQNSINEAQQSVIEQEYKPAEIISQQKSKASMPLTIGSPFANRYTLIKNIGVGGFSEVWKASDNMAEDAIIAIKIYAPERGMDERGIKQFRQEYASVLNMNHPNLLTSRYFDIWEGRPFLIMPYISGGSLGDRLHDDGPFSEQKLKIVLSDISSGLAYLHSKDIIHQDIKPDNILIGEDGRYLLTDFGISSRLRSTLRKSTTTGVSMTVAYAPPERFDAVPKNLPAGDIFSLGVLAYELATGDVPWMGNGGLSLKQGAEVPVLPYGYPQELSRLIMQMMSLNPELRPTAAECERVLAGEIIATQNSNKQIKELLLEGPPVGKTDRRTSRIDNFTELEKKRQEAEHKRHAEEEQKRKELERHKNLAGEFVFVQGGTFMMGSEEGKSQEKPVHEVELDDFYIGTYPVAQAQWQAVMGSNPSLFKGDNHPVESVSWEDAQAFIRKLNDLTGKTFRLPTEAEWEYAARGGQKSRGYRYAGSDNLHDVGWFEENSDGQPHPVGRKRPNELGIYDMSGNVWEWCNDWYRGGYYKKSPRRNPQGPASGVFRLSRGGSWYNKAVYCRSANRLTPSLKYRYLGFRLACSFR